MDYVSDHFNNYYRNYIFLEPTSSMLSTQELFNAENGFETSFLRLLSPPKKSPQYILTIRQQ